MNPVNNKILAVNDVSASVMKRTGGQIARKTVEGADWKINRQEMLTWNKTSIPPQVQSESIRLRSEACQREDKLVQCPTETTTRLAVVRDTRERTN